MVQFRPGTTQLRCAAQYKEMILSTYYLFFIIILTIDTEREEAHAERMVFVVHR